MKISVTHNVSTDSAKEVMQTITIEDDIEGPDYHQFIQDYIKPLSLAMGYHPNTVAVYIDEE